MTFLKDSLIRGKLKFNLVLRLGKRSLSSSSGQNRFVSGSDTDASKFIFHTERHGQASTSFSLARLEIALVMIVP